ncbi:MAG: SDR family oxidoreductase [Caldilineaceae bacterium]|nr:SDR family oxidoreductase [Caldilineaceae bacterium]
MELKGKTALVTGGAHRVGKAITMMLARAGANVVVNYHASGAEAAQTIQEAEALGVEGLAVQCDVADLAAVQQMADATIARFGGVDVIVNSASYFGKTPFPSTDPKVYAMWERVTRILIDGPFFVCNTLVPSMQRRGGGVIVNIVDLSVWLPWPNFAAHAVGKAGLLAFTQSLALELAPAIRVNAIAPGLIEPPPGQSAAQRAKSTKRNLLERWSGGDAVAHAVKYLIEAEFVTGEVLTVDGGERLAVNKAK